MSDCQRLEAATKGLNASSKTEEFEAVVKLLDEVNGPGQLPDSQLHKQSTQMAKEMHERRQYTQITERSGGGTELVQQNDGKPNFLELVQGNRTEGLRLDNDGNPISNRITTSCGEKQYQTVRMFFDGKPTLRYVYLPEALVIIGTDGKPIKIEQPF